MSRVAATARDGFNDVVEAVQTFFAGDPELRRRVAFSVAMIALSAKIARADGIVTDAEVKAFYEVFSVPPEHAHGVARLYDIAKADTAGYEIYAARMARLCGSGQQNCLMLQDVLDALFHVAKADGTLHERESRFLHDVAGIFGIDEAHYEAILARHVDLGHADPYRVLGVRRDTPLVDVRRRYRRLVSDNHPDKLIGRGVPQEFIAIATRRLAAINAAYEMIERGLRHA